ncbi:MAG: hypothetical protein ACR2ML_09230 [Solirubrobacteraceae bacterium]
MLLALGLALGALALAASFRLVRLDREETAGLALYIGVAGLLPLLAAGVRIGFRVLTVPVVLASLLVAAYGLVWMLPTIVFQIAALFTRRPPVDRRSVIVAGASIVLATLALAVTVAISPPEREDLYVCLARGAHTGPVFDAVTPFPEVEDVTSVPGGVLIGVDHYATDAEVERIRQAARRSVPGATLAPAGRPCPGPV